MSTARYTCHRPHCRNRRAVCELPDGRKGVSRWCSAHLPDSMKQYVTGRMAQRGEATARSPEERIGKPTFTNSDYSICGAQAKRKSSKPCEHPAGWGTDHLGYGNCKWHTGGTPHNRFYAAKMEATEHAIVVMGNPIDVDPMDALLHCIRITAGEVAYATDQILMLTPADAVVNYAEKAITRVRGDEGNRTETFKKNTTARELNVWIRTRQAGLDRLARFCKMAIDCGIAERQVQIAEKIGGMIGAMLQAVLSDLGLSPAQQEIAPAIVRRHLTAIEGQALTVEKLGPMETVKA